MYNPSSDCGDETHTRRELYDKLKARNQHLGQDRQKYPHILPDAQGHYGSLFGNYKGEIDPQVVEHAMNQVKKAKRPAFPLNHWSYHKVCDRFDSLRDVWLKEIHQIEQDYVNETTGNGILGIDRFHYKDVSYEWFVRNYEKIQEPCMISGFTDDWAIHQWTMESMNKSFLAKENVKVGKDHHGKRIGVPFDIYSQYLHTTRDDSPVYLFESQLDRNENIEQLLQAYKSPCWFEKDLLNYCHPERRPPHRWFCIGKKASGTTMHVDPLGLLAWNSVIAGRKLWIVFDACTPEEISTGSKFMKDMPKPSGPNINTEAVGWFENVWPLVKRYMIRNNLCAKYKPRLIIQYPGETICVPGGLAHFVLNLDDSLAVTQNYCNMSNFAICWREMRVERRHAALRWLAMLKRRFPLAYKVAQELDREDNFTVTLHKPHIQGRHSKYIAELKSKDPQQLSSEEKAAIEKYDTVHAEDKVWGEEEAPFQYDDEWKYWSGSTDSSTDSESDDSSSDEDEDDDEDGEKTEEKE